MLPWVIVIAAHKVCSHPRLPILTGLIEQDQIQRRVFREQKVLG